MRYRVSSAVQGMRTLTREFVRSLAFSATPPLFYRERKQELGQEALTGDGQQRGVADVLMYTTQPEEEERTRQVCVDWCTRAPIITENYSDLLSAIFIVSPLTLTEVRSTQVTLSLTRIEGSTPRVVLRRRQAQIMLEDILPEEKTKFSSHLYVVRLISWGRPRWFQDETLGRVVVRNFVFSFGRFEINADKLLEISFSTLPEIEHVMTLQLPIVTVSCDGLEGKGIPKHNNDAELWASRAYGPVSAFLYWLVSAGAGFQITRIDRIMRNWSITLLREGDDYVVEVAARERWPITVHADSLPSEGSRVVFSLNTFNPDMLVGGLNDDESLAFLGTWFYGFKPVSEDGSTVILSPSALPIPDEGEAEAAAQSVNPGPVYNQAVLGKISYDTLKTPSDTAILPFRFVTRTRALAKQKKGKPDDQPLRRDLVLKLVAMVVNPAEDGRRQAPMPLNSNARDEQYRRRRP